MVDRHESKSIHEEMVIIMIQQTYINPQKQT